ncbi:endopeptidase La [bacterium]|nr:endopeptidase La [bacterium]
MNDKEIDISTLPSQLPVFPVRDQVIFPHMLFPLLVGREGTLRAIENAMMNDRLLILLAQQDSSQDEVEITDLYSMGVVARIVQVLKLPNGLVKVLVEGVVRAKVIQHIEKDGVLLADLEIIAPIPFTGEDEEEDTRVEGAIRHTLGLFRDYISLNKNLPDELLYSAESLDDPTRLADFIASQITIPYHRKQDILECETAKEQLLEISSQLAHEIEILEVEKSIEGKVREKISSSQRTYFLQEQLRIIKKELGEEGDEDFGDILSLQMKLANAKLSPEAREKADEELEKLRQMPMMSPEASVLRNYIDWLVSLPWKKKTKDRHDLIQAEKILDEDHYGLRKPKERILEHLAVLQLVKKMRGPIICLVGPPGVGKTSMGRSIAHALNRKFVRISLGGVRDEAEIRGHRRTYIGSLPGRIIQKMKKAGVINPVFLLDEIDKMSTDFRGDPASALLEVLDPEQNSTFADHYLEVEYDLSQVMFITTANTRHGIPLPLQDRMEIIELPGYLTEEKLHIATQFLIPKQLEDHGLRSTDIHFSQNAILAGIEEYTREAGVRELERLIAKACRRVARQKAQKKFKGTFNISTSRLKPLLGVPPHHMKMLDGKAQVGTVIGLAWTPVGGDILKIQVRHMPGKEKFTLTGMLGDVMKESARAALTYIRSQTERLELDPKIFRDNEIHIHIPEGAIPKDGPSAGAAIATAILSAFSGIPVRGDLAMTGEITLQGDVLPIGGVNEKVMAAQRHGVKTILLPKENIPQWEDRPQGVGKGLTVHFVEDLDQVWDYALLKGKK